VGYQFAVEPQDLSINLGESGADSFVTYASEIAEQRVLADYCPR
jgi:hypothetical protein